ncbi:MAG: hypothetical protein NTV87_07090 [Ignavibacteriae bacterium]|jgi:hypothetical protein|nr:hypothetical protein [Ignavibacteriota bacterium]
MLNNKINILFVILLAGLLLAGSAPLKAQNDNSQEMNKLMDEVKADKKALIMSYMGLTDAENKSFLPVYNEYQAELKSLNVRLMNVIDEYAKAYKGNSVTDELARKLLDEAVSIDNMESEMKVVYSKKLLEILPPVKVFRYLQMENKIRAAIKYELATGIPLM